MTNCRNGLGIKVKFKLMPQCIINEKYLLLSNYYHFKIYTCKNRPKISDIFATIDDLINFPDTQNFWQFLTSLTEWTPCFYSRLKPLNLLEFALNKSLSFFNSENPAAQVWFPRDLPSLENITQSFKPIKIPPLPLFIGFVESSNMLAQIQNCGECKE